MMIKENVNRERVNDERTCKGLDSKISASEGKRLKGARG